MGRVAAWMGLTACVALVVGCNTGRQPSMEQLIITPSVLRPAESARITVKVWDRFDIVDHVEGVVQEDTRIKLPFHDDGLDGDHEANDNEWTVLVDVPLTAPPAEFTLVVSAYNSSGEVIKVQTTEGVKELSATGSFIIQDIVLDEMTPAPIEEPETPAE